MGLVFPKNTHNAIPHSLNFIDCKDIIEDTRVLLEQNQQELQFKMILFLPSFKFHQQQWAQSKLIAEIRPTKNNQEKSQEPSQITLDMEQVYRIHEVLKHFRKNLQEPQERITVGGQETDKDCCICFDNKANMVLPCGHPYCSICTSKHIIQQEEHKCPICRRSFHDNNGGLEKRLYEMIEEDKTLFEQARIQILEILSKNNRVAVQRLKEEEGKLK